MTTISPSSTGAAVPSAVSWLRTVLRANSIVTGISSVVLVAAAGAFADLLDVDTIAVGLVGAALLPFALTVAWAARADVERLRTLALAIGVADVGWVVGTVVLVAFGAFSTEGGVLALLVAVMVGGFALAELRGSAALR